MTLEDYYKTLTDDQLRDHYCVAAVTDWYKANLIVEEQDIRKTSESNYGTGKD